MEKQKGRITLTIFLWIVVTDVLEALSQLLFKSAAEATGIHNVGIENALQFLGAAAANPDPWLAILFHIINFAIWIGILSRIDLSAAHPIGSTSFIFVPIFAVLFLHEHVSFARWVGTLLIMGGIYFVTKSTRASEET